MIVWMKNEVKNVKDISERSLKDGVKNVEDKTLGDRYFLRFVMEIVSFHNFRIQPKANFDHELL